MAFDPKSLLPVIQGSFPKAKPDQLMEALTKLGQAHPDLSGAQALAAIQHYMKQKEAPSIGTYSKMGRMI